MPLRVYGIIALISLSGLFIASFLLARLWRSWRARAFRDLAGNFAYLLFFAALAVILATTFIPCFSLSTEVICRGPARSDHEKRIALTFDDGPNEPTTSQILDILDRERVPATFFLLGKNVERSRPVVERMIREGFAIGNHSWDHRPMIFLNREEVDREIGRWEETVRSLSQPSIKLFRSPHGWKTPVLESALKEKGYRLIGWTRGVWDSDRPGADVLLRRLTRDLKGGEIILLHDGEDIQVGADRSQTVAVLPDFIHDCREKGFRFVTISEMLRQKGDL